MQPSNLSLIDEEYYVAEHFCYRECTVLVMNEILYQAIQTESQTVQKIYMQRLKAAVSATANDTISNQQQRSSKMCALSVRALYAWAMNPDDVFRSFQHSH